MKLNLGRRSFISDGRNPTLIWLRFRMKRGRVNEPVLYDRSPSLGVVSSADWLVLRGGTDQLTASLLRSREFCVSVDGRPWWRPSTTLCRRLNSRHRGARSAIRVTWSGACRTAVCRPRPSSLRKRRSTRSPSDPGLTSGIGHDMLGAAAAAGTTAAHAVGDHVQHGRAGSGPSLAGFDRHQCGFSLWSFETHHRFASRAISSSRGTIRV